MQRVVAKHAKRQVPSGGLHPAGRVLEVAGKRLEQQDDQEVCQQVGLGGARIGSRWRLETNQPLQSLEAKFDAPSQSIEREYILGGELVPCERRDQNDPASRVSLEMTRFSSCASRRALRREAATAPAGFLTATRRIARGAPSLRLIQILRSISPCAFAARNWAIRSNGRPLPSSQRAFFQPARIKTSAPASRTAAMRSGCR